MGVKRFTEPRIKLSIRVTEKQRDMMLEAIKKDNKDSIKSINDYLVSLAYDDFKEKGII